MRKLAMIAAVGLALSGCSVSQDKASAEAGVVHFHDMLDAGRYHDIFAGGEPEFRQTGSEQDAARFLQMIHDRLGSFRSSQQTGWRVNFATGGSDRQPDLQRTIRLGSRHGGLRVPDQGRGGASGRLPYQFARFGRSGANRPASRRRSRAGSEHRQGARCT